jgi:hypothetical protein
MKRMKHQENSYEFAFSRASIDRIDTIDRIRLMRLSDVCVRVARVHD